MVHQRGRDSVVLGATFLPSNLGSSPSGSGGWKVAPFLFLGPPRMVSLSPPRCLTCSLGLAGCSVGCGTSRGARKLARTPALSKKKCCCWCILCCFGMFYFYFLYKQPMIYLNQSASTYISSRIINHIIRFFEEH